MRKTVLIVLILHIIYLASSAQRMISISDMEGFPDAKVYSLYQDRLGYIWICTKGGMIKFDGKNFTVFDGTKGMPNAEVWDVTIDDQNRIWCHTRSEHPFYIQDDSVHILSTGLGKLYDLKYKLVRDGLYLSASFVLEYKFVNDRLQKVNQLNATGINPMAKYILSSTDSLGYLYALDVQKGTLELWRRGKNTDEFVKNIWRSPNYQGLGSVHFTSQHFFGKYLLLASSDGNILLNLSRGEVVSHPELAPYTSRDKWNIYRDSLITASYWGDLIIYDSLLTIIDRIPSPFGKKSYNTLLDRAGNRWYNHEDGVSMLSAVSAMCQYYFPGKPISMIDYREGDHLLAAYEYDGLHGINLKTGETYPILNNKALETKAIRRLDGEDYVIANTGLLKLKPKSYDSERISATPAFFSASLKDAFEYGSDFYLFSFIYLYRVKSLELPINPKDTAIMLSNGMMHAMPHQNKVWLGSNNGLWVMDSSGRKPIFTTEFKQNVTSFLSLDSLLLVGTQSDGVYVVQHDKIYHVPSTDNLSVNNMINSEEGDIWLATSTGIWRLRPSPGHITDMEVEDIFTESDGLSSDFVNHLLVRGDTLYAAGTKGITVMPWKEVRNIFDVHLFFEDTSDLIKITPEDRKNSHIDFNLLNLGSKVVRTSYKIDGYSDEWHDVEGSSILLPDLSPGDYRLSLKVADQHGNYQINSKKIQSLPLWHELNTVRFLIWFFVVLLFSAGIYYAIYRQKHLKFLKLEREKKISDVQLFALRSQMNPHFINNSLNAIQYLINHDRIDEADSYIAKFARLVRTYFDFSQESSVPLEEELQALKYYLSLEKLRFEKRVDYQFDTSEMTNPKTPVPSMFLQPVVENSIKHGIFHLPEGVKGMINIKVSQGKDITNIIITDNGVGLVRSRAINAHRAHRLSSTNVLENRIDLLNKSSDFEVIFERKEIVMDGTVGGTQVVITIKNKHHYE